MLLYNGLVSNLISIFRLLMCFDLYIYF